MDRFIVVYDGERMVIEDTAPLPGATKVVFRTGFVSFADDMQEARWFCEGLADDYNRTGAS